MIKNGKFSRWIQWQKRDELEGIKNPGTYCIAISDSDISGQKFDWINEIKYIGMSNSVVGLKGRLQQFDNTIFGKEGHGGARRFRKKYPNYQALVKKLFVSICYIECKVTSNEPDDLEIMGEIARLEYHCLAEYVKRNQDQIHKLPEFNDKKRSPKDNHRTQNKK